MGQMQKSFTIKPYYHGGRSHSLFPQQKYPQTHPYLYHATDAQGWDVFLMSRRSDYKSGQHLIIDCSLIAGSHYLDNSLSPGNTFSSPTRGQPAIPPGTLSTDVIVMVESINSRNGRTEVT